MRSWTIAAGVLAVAVAGYATSTVTPDEPPPVESAPVAAVEPEPELRTPAREPVRRNPQPAARVAERFAVAAAVPEAAGEDELSLRWDELSKPERVDALRRQFRRALRAADRGKDVRASHSRADAALSGLRAELYATARGRSEHRRLEALLDKRIAEARGGDAKERQP